MPLLPRSEPLSNTQFAKPINGDVLLQTGGSRSLLDSKLFEVNILPIENISSGELQMITIGKNAARRCLGVVAIAAPLVLMGGVVVAQVTDQQWSLMPSGGGESSSQDHHLVTTLGQTTAMEFSNNSYSLQSGFLAGIHVLGSPSDPPDPQPASDIWLVH